MRSLFDLNGKVVVASGGLSGIGLGFLQGCARQGAEVVIWDRSDEARAEVSARLTQLGAARVHFHKVDVSRETEVDEAMSATLTSAVRVDCMFANAGINRRVASFTELDSETWHGLLDVNLHGAFYTLRAAARHMKARAEAGDPGGSLVACGSLSVFHGLQGMEHYAAAKGALLAMIKGLAVELGPFGVRANMLIPGFIATGLTSSDPRAAAVMGRFAAMTPLGRVGELGDIEGPAAYLASDASRYQSGSTIIVDGGRVVRNV